MSYLKYAQEVGGTTDDKPVTNIVNISTLEEREDYIKNNKRVIIKYTASWCGPCKRIQPLYNDLCNETDTEECIFLIEDVDLDLGDLMEDVAALPSFHFIHDGVLVDVLKGCDEDKLTSAVKLLLDMNTE